MAKGAHTWRWLFDDGSTAGLSLDGAEVICSTPDAPFGSGALRCDTRYGTRQWNEFLRTLPESIPLRAGHVVDVSFAVRVLDRGDNSFYCMVRSWSQIERGGNYDQHHFYRAPEQGRDIVITRRFVLDDTDDYHVILGIQGRGCLLIDNLTVTDRGSGKDDGTPVRRIRTGLAPPYAADLAWIRQLRKEHGIAQRLRRAAVILCNEGAGNKAVPSVLVPDLAPDYIDWNPIGPLGKTYGIATSIGGAEYQEYYRVEGEDVWEQRMTYFGDDGFIRRLDGSTDAPDNLWAEGGYRMCQNADRWHRYQQQTMVRRLDTYEDICQDNLTWANFHMGGCWCNGCESKFRVWLARRYSEDERRALGVEPIDSFSFRAYCNSEQPFAWQALVDPISREWILFQNQAHLAAWCDSVVAIKRRGLELGRPVAVYGNQIALHWSPYGVSLSPFCDAIEVENEDQPLVYLIARGVGADGQAVWTRGSYGHPTRDRWPDLRVETWANRFGCGLTYGGLRVVSLGWNSPWTGDPAIPDPIDDPDLYALFQRYSQFLRAHRAAIGPQRTLTRIAIVYSVPTLLWYNFEPLGLSVHGPVRRWGAVPEALMDAHVPFDVIVFGHPELWDDSEDLERLANYSAIVLPDVTCLSATQAQVLRQRAAESATLYTVGEFGGRDENLNPAPDRAAETISHQRFATPADLVARLAPLSTIRVTSSQDIRVNAFVSTLGPFVILHAWNPESGVPSSDARTVVEIQLPPDVDGSRAVRASFEHAQEDVTVEGAGTVRLTLPPVLHYSMVVIGNTETYARVQAELEAKLAADREMIRKWWK